MPGVSIRGVRKSFGTLEVIHGVDVAIEDGAFVVLVGPSGCGKTTLHRMIAGLENISGGEIAIDGRVINKIPPKGRDIAMVFQNYALYPHMTVRANMAFSLMLAKAPDVVIEQRVSHAAGILGLAELLGRYPRQLSGGQRQRVAMGRAIVRNPKVFLFDEPLSNLDAKLRVQMRTEIKELHQRLSATTIYVTHDQIEAMTMADKIVVMRGGNVEQAGDPLTLYDRPVNQFVAGFIGSPAMNFIHGEVEPDGFRADGDVLWPLPVGLGTHLAGRTIIYGVRPEHLVLASNALKLSVQVVEPTGSETQIMGEIGMASIVCLLRERLTVRPGTTIDVSVDPVNVHLFDAESTAAVRVDAARPAHV
ncbi:MAG: ABC transporter ATP-binding protein [Acetobacteraceae bacterium]